MGLANCQSSLHNDTILMITTTSTGTWLFQFSVILLELQLDICRGDFVFNLSGKTAPPRLEPITLRFLSMRIIILTKPAHA